MNGLSALRSSSAPGPSATVQVVVGGTPTGDVKFHLAVADGVVTTATPGNNSKADVALTIPHAEAQAMLAGELDPNVAFMRGRMKTAGDPGLLAALRRDAHQRGTQPRSNILSRS